MNMRRRLSSLCFAVLVAAPAFNATRAQCAEWSSGFELPGLNGPVRAMTVYDDGLGAGPALYVGGEFTTGAAVAVSNIAKWDGSNWSSLLGGVNGVVHALEVFGGQLYVGGEFSDAGGVSANRIAVWNGLGWSTVSSGMNNTVRCLKVFSGRLYAGGTFTLAGGVTARRLASTNGATWTVVGSTAGSNGVEGSVFSLETFGTSLYVGGAFFRVNGPSGILADNLARWSGTTWSVSGIVGIDGSVRAMTTHDDGLGGGVALFVGGDFTAIGFGTPTPHILKWNGTTTSQLSTGTNGSVFSLASYNSGSGAALYAAGAFTGAGGTAAIGIGRWNGSAWSGVGGGTNSHVYSLATFDEGGGLRLYAGGLFTLAGAGSANHIARWNGTTLAGLGSGVNDGLTGTARALMSFDEGSGPRLFAGGDFVAAGATMTPYIARWNGVNWSPLGAGTGGPVFSLANYDDGTGGGTQIYAGGTSFSLGGPAYHSILKWNGSTWNTVGAGLVNGAFGEVRALAVFDDGSGEGPLLHAGGDFTTSAGVLHRRVAKWNGTVWSPLGYGVSGPVNALVVYDDGLGDGPALYVGGSFGVVGGSVPANFIAKWNGTTWSALGTGTDGIVKALAVFDDGSGPELFVGGEFLTAGGVASFSIAKWNGTTWSSPAGGKDNIVNTLCVFDDGSGGGEALYAAGDFFLAGGIEAHNVARWNGTSWTTLGDGTNGAVRALVSFDDGFGGGADLFAGGDFTMAGGKLSSFVGAWRGCGGPGTAYCFGDGLDPIVTADCPCFNYGSPFHGCQNPSLSLGGARLDATGSVLAADVRLICTGIPNNGISFFVEGTATVRSGVVLGDGVSCVGGTRAGFGTQMAGHGGNPPNTVSFDAPFVPPGTTRYYYVNYRTALPGFCPPELFNVSNSYEIAW